MDENQLIPQQFILTSIGEKDFNGGLIHTTGQARLPSLYLASHILANKMAERKISEN
jgi:hypothetical protein